MTDEEVWVAFAAAAIPNRESLGEVADVADAMLEEYRKRRRLFVFHIPEVFRGGLALGDRVVHLYEDGEESCYRGVVVEFRTSSQESVCLALDSRDNSWEGEQRIWFKPKYLRKVAK